MKKLLFLSMILLAGLVSCKQEETDSNSHLCFRLYGEGVSVRSVILSGNNWETTSVTLDKSAAPVALDASASKSVSFEMVIPPVSFSKGYTLTVVDDKGKVYVQSTTESLTFERGKKYVMKEYDVKAGFVDFGIYPAGGETYVYKRASDRMSIYEALGNGWFRFLQIPTAKMLEIGPIPLTVAEGDAVSASLASSVNGEVQGSETNYTLRVQSYHNGILNLVSDAGDRFVIRF